ncbi:uncharacterized protein LOC113473900 isoform X2 [Diaphorina citri]|uniref:Uncharacterized protein LOC113473900 isoform X2 n=1 Tax=Diaphorina citri TaxID=121845 RepID=A0A3Q0JLB6_DIACI|nr:uncharacterized protein LOC113473900 isoform X2 [Diaphorina citri]
MENTPVPLLKNVAISNWAVAIPIPLNMCSSGATGTSGVPCSSSWWCSVCAGAACGGEAGCGAPLTPAHPLVCPELLLIPAGVSRPSTADVHPSSCPRLTAR